MLATVDARGVWIQADSGLGGITWLPLEDALCVTVLDDGAPLILEDARKHPRFAGSALVAGPTQVTFYAGFPLVDEAGQRFGVLGVMARRPHLLSAQQRATLQCLALAAAAAFELVEASRDESVLRAFADTVQGEVLICGADDLRLTYASRAAMARIDQNPAIAKRLLAEFTLPQLQDWLPPADMARMLRDIASHGEPSGHAFRQHRPTAAELHVRIVPFESEGRAHIGVLSIDVTQRNQAERATRTELERCRLALDGTGDGVWDWDVTSGALLLSQGLAAMLGEQVAEIAPHLASWLERIHPEDTAQAQEDLARCFRGESHGYRSEHRLRTRAGDYKWVLWRGAIAARDDQGRPQRLVGTLKDATEHRKLQTDLAAANANLEDRIRKRTQALETANEDLRLFSAASAHDLAAPLRSIEGFSQVLLEQYGDQWPQPAHALFKRIALAAARMQHMIDGIGQFLRAGERQVAIGRVDVAELVQGILQTLAPSRGTPAASFTIGVLPPCVGDADLLEIVFSNLINNAIKFSAERAAPEIEIGSSVGPAGVDYFVRDNGVGFDPARFPGLFQPFKRLHATNRFEGSGIGLATVARLLKRGGGRIWVESAPDAGATFHFRLMQAAELAANTT